MRNPEGNLRDYWKRVFGALGVILHSTRAVPHNTDVALYCGNGRHVKYIDLHT